MVKEKGSRKTSTSRTARRLERLGRQWAKTLGDERSATEKHLKLAAELYELALDSEGAQLRIVEQLFSETKTKPKIMTMDLGNPRAALLTTSARRRFIETAWRRS